jgi:hypothetical protein
LLFKQDPQSKKFILNNSLVFEGGRYRYSGEKYLTISRKNSLTDSLSNQGSRKSLARSVRSTRVPTVENFHVPDDFRNSRNELKTSNSRFNVKVSVASWRVTSGRSKHSETKDQFPPSAKDQRTPRSSSQLIEDNGRLLANIGFNFKTMQDSIRKEMPTDSKKFNSSFNSVVKSTDVEEKYREQLRGKSSRNVGSQRGSDALWLR